MSFPGLSQKIKQQYKKALDSGSISFTDTEVIELDDESTGIPFEVRYAPQLAKKPTKDSNDGGGGDPFAPPYQPDLYVAEDTIKEDENDRQGEEFVVLLNKFCITPRHFLLVTKQFTRQTTPLSPLEVYATWSILKQLGQREKHLAFFNCGDQSGASQPHKHLQLIPLQNGVAPFDAFIDSNVPQDRRACFQLPLPYANFTALLDPPSPTSSSSISSSEVSDYLGTRFLLLLDLMIDHLRRLSEVSPELFSSSQSGEGGKGNDMKIRLTNLSYNVILTTKYIHLVPRYREKYLIKGGEGSEGGVKGISINSLGFAGMVLVKDETSLKEVEKVGVLEVLKEVGFRPVVEGDTVDAEVIGEKKEEAKEE